MSYDDGWAAIHGEMPARIPRTEYSVEQHWPLIEAVTGLPTGSEAQRQEASIAFRNQWDYGFQWSCLFHGDSIGGPRTNMGHAVYQAEGVDFQPRVSCPFADPADVFAYDPREQANLLDEAELTTRFDEHYRQQCAEGLDAVRISGIYVSLFSGLIDIFGWEQMLLAGGEDPAAFGAVAERYAAWITPAFTALAASALPVVSIHDDLCWTSGPVFAPDWYRQYVFPAYRRLWRPILDAGKRIIFTCDGDYSLFFDDIVAAGAHVLVMEPCSDMAGFAERYGRTHGFVGNADTRVLLTGERTAIRAEVERCIAIGRDCPGFIMAIGNHIPANTPVEAALYYHQCFEEMRVR